MLKNIVVINDSAYVNGGEAKVAIMSALALSEMGYRVIFFSAMGTVCEELRQSNIEVVLTNQYDILSDPDRFRAMRQGIWNAKSRKMLAAVLKELSPAETVVHVHGWIKALSVSIFDAIDKSGIPMFITLHQFFLYCPNGGLYDYKKQKICNRKPMSLQCMVSNCDARNYPQKVWRVIRQMLCNARIAEMKKRWNYISISNLTEKIFRREFGNGMRLTRINNPIEVPMPMDFDDTKRDSYLFMARLSPEKGLDLFCEAISQLGLKGIVLGSGELYDSYKNKYPNVEFAGWVSGNSRIEYLQRTKCLVFASKWYETFGLSVAESILYGIPCIIPDECAARELVAEEDNGFVFHSGELSSLKEAIIRMENSNLVSQRLKISKSINAEDYSLERHVQLLVEAYSRTL